MVLKIFAKNQLSISGVLKVSYRIPKCESDSAFLREIQDTDIVKNEEL